MLSLRQITKNYEVGGQSVPALRDGKLSSDAHPALPCRVYRGEATDFLF